MQEINTDIIDIFMDRTRVAGHANSKEVRLTMNEAQELVVAISQMFARINGLLEKSLANSESSAKMETVSIIMDGGKF